MKNVIFALFAAASLLALTAFATSQEKPAAPAPAAKAPAANDAQKILAQKGAYPLTTCLVSGEELGAKAVDVLIDDRLVRVCCENCVEGAKKDKEKFFAAIDIAVIKQQRAGYPLETCVISGEKLGEGAVSIVQGTYMLRVCCNDCTKEVRKSPEEALKKLHDAYIEKQRADYPLDTCVVSDEKLGSMGEPIDYLWGVRLYRLCCGGCKKSVQKNADALWKKIADAKLQKPQK